MPKKKTDEFQVGTLADVPAEGHVSTGDEDVDQLLGGGFPRRRITQIWGQPGAGKSHLLAKTLANLQGKALYVDAEFALNKERLKTMGVPLAKFDYIADSQLEKVAEYIIENVDKYDLIIIDTLAKLTPMTIQQNEVGSTSIGLAARQIAHFEAKLRPKLYASEAAIVCINQVRANLGFGPVETQAYGGWAWGHTIDLNLKFFKGGQNKIIKQTDGVKNEVGHWCSVKVEKSRVGTPFQETRFQVLYTTEDI